MFDNICSRLIVTVVIFLIVVGSVWLVYFIIRPSKFYGIATITTYLPGDWDSGKHTFRAAIFRKGFTLFVYTGYRTKEGFEVDVTNTWATPLKKLDAGTLKKYPPASPYSLAAVYPLSYYTKNPRVKIDWMPTK